MAGERPAEVVERVQLGVRMERSMVKVLRASPSSRT